MTRTSAVLTAALLLAATPADADGPQASRPPLERCSWQQIDDAKLGLAAWVQRCDFGFRKIDFEIAGNALAIRFSDGGKADPLVEVLDLAPGEAPETGVERLFAARTERAVAARCVLAPYEPAKTPAGRKRYVFVPGTAYAKELAKTASPDEVPEPPCGPYGTSPDGIQYFETQPESGVAKVLFVRVGQDEPLFDEQTLRLVRVPRS